MKFVILVLLKNNVFIALGDDINIWIICIGRDIVLFKSGIELISRGVGISGESEPGFEKKVIKFYIKRIV